MKCHRAIMLLLLSASTYADKPLPDLVAQNPEPPGTEVHNEVAAVSPPVANDTGTDRVSPDNPLQETVAPPRPFIAVYDARISAARGETTMALSATDGGFEFSSVTRPRGLARMLRSEPITECSRFTLSDDGRWQAQQYRYRDGRKDSDIRFDIAAGYADASYIDEQARLPVTPGTTDRLLEQLLVSRAVVENEAIALRQVIDRASLQDIEWQRLGTERIRVDAGSFDTVKFRRQRSGSKRSSVIWFAPALDGVPVRIEQYRLDDRQARAELKSYTDAASLQARGTVTPVCP